MISFTLHQRFWFYGRGVGAKINGSFRVYSKSCWSYTAESRPRRSASMWFKIIPINRICSASPPKNPNGPHSFGLILLGPIQLGPIAFDPIAFVYVDLPLIICVKLYLDYFNGVPSSSVQSLGQTRSARVSRGQQG